MQPLQTRKFLSTPRNRIRRRPCLSWEQDDSMFLTQIIDLGAIRKKKQLNSSSFVPHQCNALSSGQKNAIRV